MSELAILVLILIGVLALESVLYALTLGNVINMRKRLVSVERQLLNQPYN